MPTIKQRLQAIEARLPSRDLGNIRDVADASSAELALFLLDRMPADLGEWTDIALLAGKYPPDKDACLADPLEDFVAYLFRTVNDFNPLFAARFVGRLPERVVECGKHQHRQRAADQGRIPSGSIRRRAGHHAKS